MAYISVTYTFANGAGNYIDATQVNQNYTDIINGLSDGTADINVGTITTTGNVVLGNVIGSDTVTCNAKLGIGASPTYEFDIQSAGNITGRIKSTNSMVVFRLDSNNDIGSQTLQFYNNNLAVAGINSQKITGEQSSTMKFYVYNAGSSAEFMRATKNQHVRIGTGSAADPTTDCILELTGKGALRIPQLTMAEMNALTPADGMFIYNISAAKLYFYSADFGGSWAAV